MAVEQVIIEFISDTSQLAPGIDQLEKIGKVEKSQAEDFKKTNTEINKQVAALKNIETVNNAIGKSGTTLKKSITDVVAATKGMSQAFTKDFKEGAVQALKEAGVSVEQFEKALEGATTEGKSLKAQLREMVAALAQMKVEGKDNTEQYKSLAQQAGRLKDAIGDANQEVKNFGSDTSTFDGLISTVQGLAGGFAVVQGASALFGDESEELQKTLLRVNAAMAILQGLQSIQTVLQKESAAATFANTIATKAQSAALAVYNFVVGASTGLTKAFKIALAATGVGLLVIGLIKLVEVLKQSNDEMADANALIESQQGLVDRLNESIQRSIEVQEARARSVNATESDIIRIQGKGLIRQREALFESNKNLAKQRDSLGSTSEAWFTLNTQIENNANAIAGLDNDILVKSINLEKQIADERADAEKKRADAAKQAAEDAKKRREDALQKEKEARAAGFADFKASVELELLAAEKGSQAELEIKKRLARAELQVSLDNEKLTDNQRKLLIKQYFQERIDLEKAFAKEKEKVILESIAADIQTELQGLELSTEQRLSLTETAITLTAQMEADAANGNAAKIGEINAKRDKAIRDARIASIQEVVNYEIALAESTNGPEKRRLAAVVASGEAEVYQKVRAVERIATLEADSVQKRIEALNSEREQKLISERDYLLQYAQLTDQGLKIWEDAEKSKTDITKEEGQKRQAQTIKDIKDVVEVAQVILGVLEQLNSLQSEKEQQRLDEQRQHLKDLQDSGAITEKEAIQRQKKIDAEERKAKNEQAKRDKQVAVFKALLAIPLAFLQGLSQGGIVTAIIYGALAAVSAAIVIAKPVPKFGKGKKNSYEGPAEVGETGTELIEHNGRMFVADKPQYVWLSKKDKVFNPTETVKMLSSSKMNTERDVQVINNSSDLKIDYDKIGEAVGKHVQTNVFVDGIQEQAIRKNSFNQWLNNRRSF